MCAFGFVVASLLAVVACRRPLGKRTDQQKLEQDDINRHWLSDPTVSTLFCTDALRAAEARALASCEPMALMRRAAEALADAAARDARMSNPDRPIIALVGPGNNGGDALLATVLLRERGFDARALLLSDEAPRVEDARRALEQARRARLPFIDQLPEVAVIEHLLFLDGLFGIGLSRAIEGRAADWIRRLNAAGARVIAADVPSGIDADSGAIVGGSSAPVLRALRTVTFLGDKPGLHTGAGIEFSGVVEVHALGVAMLDLLAAERGPDVAVSSQSRTRQSESSGPAQHGALVGAAAAVQLVRPLARTRGSHKGTHGHVAVWGGTAGMSGAALLAALGAQRSGAGKVSVGAPDRELPPFETQPQLMTLSARKPWPRVSAIVAGCGLGQSARAEALLARLLGEGDSALVLDADALNLLASSRRLQRALGSRLGPSVLTPHPLEAARLLDSDVRSVQARRIESACAIARNTGAIVLLKGAGSVCAHPQGHWAIIDAGNPALATAGTGDVLAGVIGGLIAQGLTAATATCLGAWVHGRAAEAWAIAAGGVIGMSAAELPDLIRMTLNQTLAGTIRDSV